MRKNRPVGIKQSLEQRETGCYVIPYIVLWDKLLPRSMAPKPKCRDRLPDPFVRNSITTSARMNCRHPEIPNSPEYVWIGGGEGDGPGTEAPITQQHSKQVWIKRNWLPRKPNGGRQRDGP